MNITNSIGLPRSSRSTAQRIESACQVVRFEPLEQRRLMSVAGGGEPPDPIEWDLNEPNNSFSAATNLGTTFNAQQWGQTLHQAGTSVDIDYFKFVAPSDGIVIAQIEFTHLQGNLALRAYNSAQQQIAMSDTSTPGVGRETVTFAAQEGQTYYLRVSGQTSPDYGLDMHALAASFDWNMPKRTGAQFDQFGKPMFPNTRDYARPNPVVINGVETPRYGVSLQALSALPGDGVSYQWSITSSQYSTSANGASVIVDLPQGQYNVQLNASVGGTTVTSNQTITVKDTLIVAIGDSYGAGEGNPHSPVQYDFFGFPTRGAIWADSPDGQEAIYHRMAHRSSSAAVAQVAMELENSDPKSSVTFVFLDHTGATVSVGLLGSQPTGDPGAPGSTPPQVTRLAQIIGDRAIDTMFMSIGGNDMGFGPVLARLLQADPFYSGDGYWNELQDIFGDALANIQLLRNTWYPQLAQALNQFSIRQTLLTEYPDLARDSTGGIAEKVLDDIAPTFEVDRYELEQASIALVGALQGAMRDACRAFDWTYVDGIHNAYRTHGYGDWLRKATDSVVNQGPIGNRNAPTLGDLSNTTGTMHPMNGGLTAQRDRINATLSLANLITTGFSISPYAFLPGVGSSSYSITVRNTSLKATAPASIAQIYVSPDRNVDRNDQAVVPVAIPALAPGESITVTGNLPQVSDPFHSNNNAFYVAPVLDFNSAITESNEMDNFVANHALIPGVTPERDVVLTASGLRLNPTPINIDTSLAARLGLDEIIGEADLDVYTFNATAGQRLGFDIDAPGTLNTFIRVFPVVGGNVILPDVPLASNDNGFAPGETGNPNESYLAHTFSQSGQYALVVGHVMNRNADPMYIADRYSVPDGTGDYTLHVTPLESIAPTVVASSFDVNGNKLTFRFSENVGASINNNTLSLLNTTTNQTVSVTATYDAATNTATFRFPGFPTGLPAGDYRATIARNNVFDPSGNTLAADAVLNFFALPGDADRDRDVDLDDFNILASNFNTSGKTFSQGNFNYDAAGNVDLDDFNILAARFGQVMGPSASGRQIAGAGAKDRMIDDLAEQLT